MLGRAETKFIFQKFEKDGQAYALKTPNKFLCSAGLDHERNIG